MADSRTATRLVFMVTAAMFINYVDRGNLATAAPLLQSDVGLTASQLGILLSAFLSRSGQGSLTSRSGTGCAWSRACRTRTAGRRASAYTT